jgi:phospholipid transport system substrate-binding protein
MSRSSILSPLRLVAACLVLFAGLVGGHAPARAADPALAAQGTAQAFYGALLDTMKQGKALGFDGRVKKLEPVIARAYDMDVMTRLAVGSAWTGFDEATRRSVTDAFYRYTVATYANRFSSFDGERFEVGGVKAVAGQRQIVETRLVPVGDDPIALNYLMAADAAGIPRIIDVFLNGTISQIATTRSEFTAVLREGGAAGLIALLGKRVSELSKG